MTATTPPPAPMLHGDRRLIIYVVYDRRGDVGDYITLALTALRQHAERIFVVVNGSLTDLGRAKLSGVADEILVRPNSGFDIGAHRDALAHIGPRLAEFDEIILANDTWYAPIRPFGPVFERMDSRAVHFWGMTEHPEQTPNPFTGTGTMARHLQSFWVAVRRTMFLANEWEEYWAQLPEITTYNEAILLHEAVFTQHFEARGFTADVAFPARDYPSEHAAIFHADLLLRDGCPLLKRRTLFHHPTFLIRHAIIGRDLVAEADSFGYPVELIYEDLARNVAPRTMNANLGLLEVFTGADMPRKDTGEGVVAVLRSVRRAHLPLVARWMSTVDDDVRLIALVPAGEDADLFTAAWESVLPSRSVEVRSSAGLREDPLPGAGDLIVDPGIRLVVCIDARIWEGGETNERQYLRRQQLESLFGRRDWLARMEDLFEREPGLGLVFPVLPHVSTLGESIRWPESRALVQNAARARRFSVPVDEFGPLAPAAGVWVSRPAALRRFLDQPSGAVAGPAAVREGWELSDLLLPYAAGELGFHTRTVATADIASISHASLEYKLDRLLENTYGHRLEQIQFLQRAQWRGDVSATSLIKMHMRTNHPDGTHPALPALRWGRRNIARVRDALAAVRRREH